MVAFDQHDAPALSGGGGGGLDAGGSATNHEHIAMRMTVIDARRCVAGRKPAQTGCTPDGPFIEVPVREEESLVIEARRQERSEQVVDAADVE